MQLITLAVALFAAVAAASPHIPPMAIPNKDLTARNCWKVCVKLEPSWRTAQSTKFATSGHLRPNRSENIPKIAAPTERKSKVNVIAVV